MKLSQLITIALVTTLLLLEAAVSAKNHKTTGCCLIDNVCKRDDDCWTPNCTCPHEEEDELHAVLFKKEPTSPASWAPKPVEKDALSKEERDAAITTKAASSTVKLKRGDPCCSYLGYCNTLNCPSGPFCDCPSEDGDELLKASLEMRDSATGMTPRGHLEVAVKKSSASAYATFIAQRDAAGPAIKVARKYDEGSHGDEDEAVTRALDGREGGMVDKQDDVVA